MPTKIVSSVSDPQNGEISKQDLSKIIADFGTVADISPRTSRPLVKMDGVSVPVLIIEHLLAPLTDNEKKSAFINIKFGVTLPNQKDCLDNETDVANHLTVVLVLEKDGIPQMNENDFIITPGFKEFIEDNLHGLLDAACCPVIHPGNG